MNLIGDEIQFLFDGDVHQGFIENIHTNNISICMLDDTLLICSPDIIMYNLSEIEIQLYPILVKREYQKMILMLILNVILTIHMHLHRYTVY